MYTLICVYHSAPGKPKPFVPPPTEAKGSRKIGMTVIILMGTLGGIIFLSDLPTCYKAMSRLKEKPRPTRPSNFKVRQS